MKKIDADYYGYRDEDDGVLVPLEKDAQKEGTRPLLCLFFFTRVLDLLELFSTNQVNLD
jgi:pre-mRNA-splicing factor ISY1